MKRTLGVHQALYLKPLLYGLSGSDAPFDIHQDLPAQLAVKFRERIPPYEAGFAFLSPLDYARHGSEYRIIPGVAVSSNARSGTIQLYIKYQVHNIHTLAVDVRCTSEIILAKIILLEKYTNLTPERTAIQYLPMLPDCTAMLEKADAALVVNFAPEPASAKDHFSIDLVDEWFDLTELPYLHGFWVGREEDVSAAEIQALLRARDQGFLHHSALAVEEASRLSIPEEIVEEYFESFSYEFGEEQEASLSEYSRYAFYHGIIPDVPDINFFNLEPPTEALN
ncbi:MAG: MqnA/MqnD/SBP family protein [bacterium]